LTLWTQVDVEVETTLEKSPIHGKHVLFQVCMLKIHKKLLQRLCYNRDHRKGAPNFLGQRVQKSNVEPSPKRQHANTSYDVSIVDMSQENPNLQIK